MSENAKRLVLNVHGDKGKALEWLARAIPVRVRLPRDDDDMDNNVAGMYNMVADEVTIRGEDDDHFVEYHDVPWVAVLAHEGIHATQFRTRRMLPIVYLRHLPVSAFEFLKNKEECVAYLAGHRLGKLMGFDWSEVLDRYERLIDGASDDARQAVSDEADEAVEWLMNQAAEVDSRPFDDDLKRWADGSRQGSLPLAA